MISPLAHIEAGAGLAATQQLLASGRFTHPITQACLTFFLASRRHRFIQPES